MTNNPTRFRARALATLAIAALGATTLLSGASSTSQQPVETELEAASAPIVPVYRFWSPVTGSHFYTTDKTERDTVIKRWPTIWKYEKVAYYAYPGNIQPYSNNSTPVFRFWGQPTGSHFYTVDPHERDIVVDRWRSSWSYEGPRFYLRLRASLTPTRMYPGRRLIKLSACYS